MKDRIRKDFGDITELAEDIQKNGLINPPAISRNYELIAGERRLRACKSLGWKQIEVHQIDVDDAEKQLYMEISENETRKDFSMTERLDYARRLARVESAKAEQRKQATLKQNADTQNSAERADKGETRDKVAQQIGMSHDTLRKAQQIMDHKDMISAEDFADWDDGKLSTNRVYTQIKRQLAEEKRRNAELAEQNRKLEERPPETVERVVDKEAIPDDYENLKKKARQASEIN